MQRCGVTTKGASVVLDVMKYNTSIVVLDLRRNPAVDNNILRNVMEHVLINANGKEQEFQWLPTTAPGDSSISSSSSGRGASGRRTDSRSSKHRPAGGGSSGGVERRSSASSSKGCRPSDAATSSAALPPPPVEFGVPHYTAERAMRHGCASRSHLKHQQQQQHPLSYSRDEIVGITNGSDDYPQHHHNRNGRDRGTTPPPPPPEFAAAPRSVQFAGQHSESSSDVSGPEGGGAVPPSKPPRVGWTADSRDSSGAASAAGPDERSEDVSSSGATTNTAAEMKKLRVDFEQCWRHLQEESKARRQASGKKRKSGVMWQCRAVDARIRWLIAFDLIPDSGS